MTPVPTLAIGDGINTIFTSVNSYLPTFLVLFGAIGGIAIAMTLGKFLVNAIKSAFEGKSV